MTVRKHARRSGPVKHEKRPPASGQAAASSREKAFATALEEARGLMATGGGLEVMNWPLSRFGLPAADLESVAVAGVHTLKDAVDALDRGDLVVVPGAAAVLCLASSLRLEATMTGGAGDLAVTYPGLAGTDLIRALENDGAGERVLDIPVERLPLVHFTMTGLRDRARLKILADVVAMPAEALFAAAALGIKGKQDIRNLLEGLGLRLGMSPSALQDWRLERARRASREMRRRA